MFGPRPIKGQYQQGPNRYGLAAGLVSSAVSGLQAGASFFS